MNRLHLRGDGAVLVILRVCVLIGGKLLVELVVHLPDQRPAGAIGSQQPFLRECVHVRFGVPHELRDEVVVQAAQP